MAFALTGGWPRPVDCQWAMPPGLARLARPSTHAVRALTSENFRYFSATGLMLMPSRDSATERKAGAQVLRDLTMGRRVPRVVAGRAMLAGLCAGSSRQPLTT
jgi:hypothetical protein